MITEIISFIVVILQQPEVEDLDANNALVRGSLGNLTYQIDDLKYQAGQVEERVTNGSLYYIQYFFPFLSLCLSMCAQLLLTFQFYSQYFPPHTLAPFTVYCLLQSFFFHMISVELCYFLLFNSDYFLICVSICCNKLYFSH